MQPSHTNDPKQTGGIPPGATPAPQGSVSPEDAARRALAVGFELAKNASRARTLEEFQFILVNDTRALLPFDRSLLITHFNGHSALAATNNQPTLDKKSEFVHTVERLAAGIREVDRGLVLFADAPTKEDLSDRATAALAEYLAQFKAACLVVVPFTAYDSVIGHLLLEFHENASPQKVEVYALMNLVPFLSEALAQKWLLAAKPSARKFFFAALGTGTETRSILGRHLKWLLLAVAVTALIVSLCLPVSLQVGGRADVAPEYEYVAFAQMDGIVDKVSVREGDRVEKEQLLAELQATEIDYKIREAERMRESYKAEEEILRSQGSEDPKKLAEGQLVAIKGLRSQYEVEFLQWQRQFLAIKAPVEGIVLTKKVESLVGKRFKAGEPFCKIAPADTLVLEVFVRESDATFVESGLRGDVYFNFRPTAAHAFQVETISPISETVERSGAVFRVRAKFLQAPPGIKPGMQGVAQIYTQDVSLFFMLTRRLRTKLNELWLVFL
jgi:multidrug efflux pump subunit AcrA (membrane-fusion protein)